MRLHHPFTLLLFLLGIGQTAHATITFPGIGLELGAGFSTGYKWDSNIENRADGASGGKFNFSPNVSFRKTGGILTLNGNLSSTYSKYIHREEPEPIESSDPSLGTTAQEAINERRFVDPFDEESFQDYDAELKASLNEYTDAWNAGFGIFFRESNDDSFEEEEGITRSQTYGGDANVSFMLASRTFFSIGAGYEKEETEGFSDQEKYNGSISLGYRYRDDLSFSLGLSYDETDVNELNRLRLIPDATTTEILPGDPIPDPDNPGQTLPAPEETVVTTRQVNRSQSLDTRDYGVFVSGDGTFTGALSGSASVGLKQREFDDDERESEVSTFFNVGLMWSPTDLNTIRLTASQDFSTTASGESTNTFRTGVSTTRSITDKLSGGISLSFRRSEFQSPTEDVFLITTSRTVPAGTRPEDLPPEEREDLSSVDLVNLEQSGTLRDQQNRTEDSWTIGASLGYSFTDLGTLSLGIDHSIYNYDDDTTDRPDSRTSVNLTYGYTF